MFRYFPESRVEMVLRKRAKQLVLLIYLLAVLIRHVQPTGPPMAASPAHGQMRKITSQDKRRKETSALCSSISSLVVVVVATGRSSRDGEKNENYRISY